MKRANGTPSFNYSPVAQAWSTASSAYLETDCAVAVLPCFRYLQSKVSTFDSDPLLVKRVIASLKAAAVSGGIYATSLKAEDAVSLGLCNAQASFSIVLQNIFSLLRLEGLVALNC